MDMYDVKEIKREQEWLRDGRLVPLNVESEPIGKVCDHDKHAGRYVIRVLPGVRVAGEKRWHGFDPNNRLMALSWIAHKQERRLRVHWLCDVCKRVMPLESYEG